MDALTRLREGHRRAEALFDSFERTDARAHDMRARIVERIVSELSVRAALEQQVFFPAVRAALADSTDDVRACLEEDPVVSWLLGDLDGLGPDTERFDATVTVLIDLARQHATEAENELFPAVRSRMTPAELVAIDAELAAVGAGLATRGHPPAPAAPPGTVAADVVTSLIDALRAPRLGRPQPHRRAGRP